MRPVYDDLLQKVLNKTNALVLGDPTKREVYLGPVINKGSYAEFQGYCEEISQAGAFATGGKVRQDGEFAKGYFCEPTIGVNVRRDCRLWQHEMFLPITFVEKVGSLDEGMKLANDPSAWRNFGGTVNYVSERILSMSANGIAADFGVQYDTGWKGIPTSWGGFEYGFRCAYDTGSHAEIGDSGITTEWFRDVPGRNAATCRDIYST